MWTKKSILSIGHNHLIDYPTPINMNYFWTFGALASVCLITQIITGIFLAMHYTPHIDYAFVSVEHIMRDVNNGWLVRYLHSNGASMFFIIVYTHMFRGLYYGSYMAPRQVLWITGVLIFFLMVLTAFLGYVLPWGQMSFWGATVITSLFSAVPIAGKLIVGWLWGGFSVDNATLNRFFSLHYLLPFVIAGLVLVHLILVHRDGNNNPLGIDSSTGLIPFYPYSIIKYIFVIFAFLAFFLTFVCFYPNTLGHTDNYIPANPLSTPAHIVPEWYLLPFYAILRSIPDKLGGVIFMAGGIVVLAVIPFLTSVDKFPKTIRSTTFKPIGRILFWLQLANCFLLGWICQNVVESPFIDICQICTLFYFFYFLVLLPASNISEAYLAPYLTKKLK
jgi:ubiquinol-cytochrome c reductase cytochrome b subunit